jgi:hypothetical protein
VGPYTQVSAGEYHTCGLAPDGSVDCWGWNGFGQATDQAGPYTQISNEPPTAAAGGPYIVDEGSSVQLDGSGSSDAEQDAATLTYAWDFDGDGSYDDATGINPTFSAASLDGPDSVTVGLQVTDDGGLTATDTATITINNADPAISSVANDGPIDAGNNATITVTASDPAGANDPLSYEFDCDNNSTYEVGPQAGNSTACFFGTDGSFTVNVRVSDGDGGLATDSTTVTVEPVDNTPPDTSITTRPADPTNSTTASFQFSGTDDVSAPANLTFECQIGGGGFSACTSPQNYSSLTEGNHTFEVRAIDEASNTDPSPASFTWLVDTTPPVVSVTGVTNDETYVLGSVPTAGCDTQDALSGVATAASLIVSGGKANGVGSFTAICEGATDNAGNSGSASVSYSVIYDFGGFTDPIDPQAVNQVKAGQTVPAKFSLNGDQGMAILAEGYPVSQEVAACDGSASVNTVEETDTAGNSGLSYDPDSDQYSYKWKTDKGWSGTCRQLIVQFDDGSAYSALFQFK